MIWCRMFLSFKGFWFENGTKVLGAFEALLGVLEYVDSQTIQLLSEVFGPTYGPMVSRGLQITMGLLTARRGYVNDRRRGL